MKLNILIISRHKWSSRLKKHDTIKKLMEQNGLKVRFSTIKQDVGTPEVVNGRITEKWFEENITAYAKKGDYNFVIFQFSEKDGKKWGLEDGLRGHNFKDTDFYGESWVCADEHSTVKYKDGTVLNKYMKVVPHEIAHELFNQKITNLKIHDFDYGNVRHDVSGFYKKLKV